LPLVEIGRQCVETRRRKTIAQSLDLVLKPPPLLDHDDAGGVPFRGVGEITLGFLAVGTFERDAGAHIFLLGLYAMVGGILSAVHVGLDRPVSISRHRAKRKL
jgi:hypothetical protein